MTKTQYLSRDAILDADDIKTEDVAVPEWGGTVKIKALMGVERDKFEADMVKSNNKYDFANIRAKLVAMSVVDADGNRLFTDQDVAALGNKSAGALNRVFEVAQRLSGLTQEDVDELAKNSENGPADTSTSS